MRKLIGIAALALGAAGTAAAQVQVAVTVGVVAPPVHARVVVTSPHYRVYRAPVVVVRPRYHAHYHHRRAKIVVVERPRWHRHHERHW